MKARSKNAYDVIQLTKELKDEPDQKTIRPYFKDITSVEMKSSGVVVNTRNTRYDIPVGSWIMIDQRGKVSIVSDVAFNLNYVVVND
ncbi:MAG: hypothetical protein PF690_17460 [Deltaproteobacteria bacterium]|jgi:hypothetical protein|nr:hypothetical protein [Deltaproteobacteria bacterium]